jgi:hypothetical protein
MKNYLEKDYGVMEVDFNPMDLKSLEEFYDDNSSEFFPCDSNSYKKHHQQILMFQDICYLTTGVAYITKETDNYFDVDYYVFDRVEQVWADLIETPEPIKRENYSFTCLALSDAEYKTLCDWMDEKKINFDELE